jgi:hypothetical protein
MQPLWDRMSYLGTDPAYQRMFNARTGLHSAGASPVSETNRGTLANMMAEQGRLGDYVNFGGVSEKGSTKKGVYIPSRYEMENFPPDMLDAPSHAYHTTAHVPGLINLEASGKLWSDRHKVPTYVQATDPIWSDPRSPIADSHISRGVGYGDVRTAKSQDSLFKELTNPEYDDFLPWWQQASRKVDMYPRDLQAMIWNVLGPQTGVRTIGSPKLELLSGQIMKAAQRLGVSPETARDLIITGKAGAYDEGGMVPEFGGPEGFVKKGVLSTLNRLAEGKPKTVKLPGVGEMPSYPIKEIEDIAGGFARKQGRDYPVESFPAFDEDRARKVAEAYESMQHNPFDPATKRSYEALIDETMDQYRALRPLGTQFEFLKPGEGNPYKESPALGYHDVLANNRLKVFPTEGGFGSVNETLNHPLEMTKAGQIGDLPDARVNDAFRIVHDMYGHFGPGNPYFRHKGEDRAWRAHARLYSDDAIPAMTSELRGQNSWANFGPYAERNRGASQDDTVYADQKVGLLPSFAWDDYNKAEGGPVQHFQDGGPPDSDYPAIGTTDYNFSNPRDDFGEFRLTPTAAERRASMERLQNAGTRTDPVRSYLGNLGKRISDYRANQAELWSGKEYNPNDQANSQLGMMNRILLENMSGGLSHNIAARYGTNPDQLDYAAEVGRQKAMTQGARDNIHPGLRDLADVLPFATTLPFQMGTQPLMSMASSFLNPAPSYMAKIKHAADEQTVPIKKGISGMYNLLRDNFPRRLPEFDDGGVVGSGALSARLGGDPMAFVKGIIPGAVDQFGDVPGQKQVQPPPTLPPLPAPQGAGQAGQGSSGSSAFNMGLSALPMIAKMFGGAGGAGGAGAAVPEIPPIYAAGGSVDDDMLGYHVMNYAMGGYVPGFDDGGPVQPPGSMGSVMNTPQWGQNGPPGSMGSVMNTPQWGQNGPDGQPRQLIDSPIDWLTGRPADWSMAPQSAQVPPSMPGNTGQPQNVLNNMANSVMPMPPPTPQGLGQGVGALSGGMNGTGGGAGGNNPIRGSLSIQGSF